MRIVPSIASHASSRLWVRVGFARQAFNDAVTDYNNRCEMSPGSLIAGPFHFQAASLLEIPAEERAQTRAAPSVRF